jgi:hypothetical protein
MGLHCISKKENSKFPVFWFFFFCFFFLPTIRIRKIYSNVDGIEEYSNSRLFVDIPKIPNDRGQGQRPMSKLGQVIIITKTLFSSIFEWINFKLRVKVAHGLPLSWFFFEGRSTLTFMVSTWVENVPQGQILKLKEPYGVVPQMTALDERFPDHLKYWRYNVIWWRNDVKSFLKRHKMHLFTLWVNTCPNGELSQCMPECGESFCKILLALWATWFISWLINHNLESVNEIWG